MTSKYRKPLNQRCCFLFRVDGYEKVSAALRLGDAETLLVFGASVGVGNAFDALDPPDHSKNAYSRDVLKGILTSLAAVFVKASARLVACSAKACI